MSTFCRHGTLTESCPICRVGVEEAERAASAPSRPKKRPARAGAAGRARVLSGARGGRLTIRHETRSGDDGFRTPLAPGLRASADAERLADQLAFAAARLALLAADPPGLYADVAAEPETEEATWLAFLIAYLGPLEPPDDPFATIRAVRTSWAGGGVPDLQGAALGPRTSHDPARGERTLLAYRRWAQRSGSQVGGFSADPSWSETQRFERVFERLALPGLDRRARYDLLVVLGTLGRYELAAPSLLASEDDAVTRAAKRVFGIGDRLVLERRVSELAGASGVPVAAFDLALENWAAAVPATLGAFGVDDPHTRERVRVALGLG